MRFQLAQQLFQRHGREARALVAHRVRQNESAGVNQRSAAWVSHSMARPI